MEFNPGLIAAGIINDRQLTDELLATVLTQIREICAGISGAEVDELRRDLEANRGISMSVGTGIRAERQVPWLDDAKPRIEWTYWNAYKTELAGQTLSGNVRRVLDQDTDNILDECGNPQNSAEWRVQGLVMGDVQSGKTANYCGLINKAADAGYKVIVLLTGMIEELRRQTQERLDEGFVGRNSNDLIERKWNGGPIGVGRYRKRRPNVLTSQDQDFLLRNVQVLAGIPIVNINEPVLLVMKKNTAPLTNLLGYLDGQTRHGEQPLDIPLLVIDDESDNASVNTRPDTNPAAINSLIRALLGRFRRATYVGYTATPFANVFINPDVDDLFPSDFVYSLNTPTNYIGVTGIFSEDGSYRYQLVDIDDAEPVFPFKHNKELQVAELPPSLIEALETFLLSCAIRDERGEKLKHRSMLVNVSRFTRVQDRLARRLDAELYDLVEEIKQYLAVPDDSWSGHPRLASLESTWRKHFAGAGVSWDTLRRRLHASVASVKVLTINQETEAEQKLNYRKYEDTESGRRVIAVGGLTLSRGLTLLGLSVSYFYRNSKAYDTLLQMGRWFGYRPGYEDLCRVWMPDSVQDWFEHIGGVVTELRADIRRMHANRQPPRKFGMRVRSHPDLLLITARNKMRNGDEVDVVVSYSGHAMETPFLPSDPRVNEANIAALGRFATSLGKATAVGSRMVWREVGARAIAQFLGDLGISAENSAFMPDMDGDVPLVSFIAGMAGGKLDKWDVCIPQGEGAKVANLEIRTMDGESVGPMSRRRQLERVPAGSPYFKLNRQRVGDITDERLDLSQDDIERARDEWAVLVEESRTKGDKPLGRTVPGHMYRRFRSRPLLTISLIEPADPDGETESSRRMLSKAEVGVPAFVGISLSFPFFDDEEANVVTYRLNRVALRQIGALADEEDTDDDEA